ncbi:hypothetical protein Hanom_Chr08g00707761 [Helianthus anomalus]
MSTTNRSKSVESVADEFEGEEEGEFRPEPTALPEKGPERVSVLNADAMIAPAENEQSGGENLHGNTQEMHGVDTGMFTKAHYPMAATV